MVYDNQVVPLGIEGLALDRLPTYNTPRERETMNNQRSPIYYTVRTVVRVTVWGVVTALGAALAVLLISGSKESSKAVCDISLKPDFTWAWNGAAVPLTDCLAPEDVVINVDGSWGWFNPDL